MPVMATGMHRPGIGRDVVMRALLGDRQRIHIGAQSNRAVAAPCAQDADYPRAFMDLKAQIAQDRGDLCLGPRLLKPEFGMAVKVVAQRRQLLVKSVHRPILKLSW